MMKGLDVHHSMSDGQILVIGGGLAGMVVARSLATLGHRVVLVEQGPMLGGRAIGLHGIFPRSNERDMVLTPLLKEVEGNEMIDVHLSCQLVSWRVAEGTNWGELSDGTVIRSTALVLATGLEGIPPSVVPEYGHGSKQGVMTTIELEERRERGEALTAGELRSVVFIQCVGSRTERRGVPYCSALCCASSIKNALSLKEEDPTREVTVLYIDVRATGAEQEDLYREARRKGVRFIRGQPSLVMSRDGRLLVCGENTLLRELYEIPADLVVLATGLRTSPRNLRLMEGLGVPHDGYGFPSPPGGAGIFLAGSMKGPLDIGGTVRDAKATALDVHEYLNGPRSGPLSGTIPASI